MKALSLIKFVAPAIMAVSVIAAAGVSLAQQERIFGHPGGGAINADVILYRLPNYMGPYVRVQTPVANLGVNWRVRSIRLNSGQWRVCTGANYNGNCTVLRNSVPQISAGADLSSINSLTPIGVVQPPVPGHGAGPSLRGMAATFYSQPSENGQRILSCRRGGSTANCAQATALNFCQAHGYNFVGNVRQQSVGNRVYLADVLCRTTQ